MKRLIVKLAVAVALVGVVSAASAQQVNCEQIKLNIEKARHDWYAYNCVNRPSTFVCLSARYGVINNTRIYNAYCAGGNRRAKLDEDGFEIE